MGKFKNFLNEKTEDKVIYVKESGELWVTYGQGSGQTAQMQNIKRSINDKTDDKNFDSLVPKIVKWAHANKPLMSNKGKDNKLFEIPVYSLSGNGSYDIWGGDIKPIGKLYMVVNTVGVKVVSLFDNKNEAQAWIKSII